MGKLIYHFARVRPDAFVVQIGAHDATQLDPVQRYIRTKGWRGILVEPQPSVFERLKQTYADVDGLIFENVAIAPHSGTIAIHYIAPTNDPGLPEWYDALASTQRDVLLSHKQLIPDIEDRLRSMDVRAMPFGALCEKHGVEHIDFVQIDTEGYDFEILKMIEFDRFQPTMLQFEELHMDDAARRDARSFLADFGYETLGNGMDCLCLHPGRLGPEERGLLSTWRRQRARSS